MSNDCYACQWHSGLCTSHICEKTRYQEVEYGLRKDGTIGIIDE